MSQMEFKKIVGVVLLGITMLAEMYLQNKGVKILRSQGDLFGRENIIMLTENISFKESERKTDKGVFGKLEDFGLRYQNKEFRELDDSDALVGIKHEENILGLKTCNSDGETILHLAAAEGHTEVVRHLLERGLPVDIRTRDVGPDTSNQYRDTWLTPLHYAAASGNIDVLRILVDYGADISAMTDIGDTALHKAALHGQSTAVRWLLDRGANLEAKNVFGATPLSMALVNQREGVLSVLLARSKGNDVFPLRGSWPIEIQSSLMLFFLEAFILLMLRVLN